MAGDGAIPWMGVLVGMSFTAIIQSSSVTTVLTILLVQPGTLPPKAAIPIVIGANARSTSTALIAGLNMKNSALASASTNFLFNAAGVLAHLPFFGSFSRAIVKMTGDADLPVGSAQPVFNLTIALALLTSLHWAEPLLRRLCHLTSRTEVAGDTFIPASGAHA